MNKIYYSGLLLIILFGFLLRLYGFSKPIADWHSWRQVDTSAVSRNFVKQGFDILHPRFDDLSNIPSGKDNIQGYRFVEFPIYNILQAGGYIIFDYFTLEQWGRIVSIVASLSLLLFLSLLVKDFFGVRAALLTAFFFACMPYSIYYSRAVLPDMSMVSMMFGGIYFFHRWLTAKKNKRPVFFVLSLIFVVCGLLLKPYGVFYFFPLAYLLWSHYGFATVKKWEVWVYFIVAVAPLIAWRLWMQQYPEGIPANDWLYNKDNIRFKGAYFYYIFAERIAKLMLGYWGVAFLILGLLRKQAKEGRLVYAFVFAALSYLVIFAGGNIQHDYYQIVILPVVVLLVGIGTDTLLSLPKEYIARPAAYMVFIVCTLFMISFGWYHVRGFYNINELWVSVGREIDTLLPKNAKIMALDPAGPGDTTFLYQTNRPGWASYQMGLKEMATLGATHLAIIHYNEGDAALAKEYKLVKKTPEYILLDLTQKP